MIKKQAIAGSILAILLTFLSGSYNLTFATSNLFSSTTLLKSKADTTCPTPFTTFPLCGSNTPCTVAKQPVFLSKALYAQSTPKTQSSDISMEYTVAMAEPTPTITETPSVTTDSPTPTVAVQAAVAYNTVTPPAGGSANLNADVIFDMINQIRTQAGLPAFEKDPRLCDVATSRAPEVYGEVMSGNLHAGMARRTFDYWVSENIIYQNTEAGAVNWWMNSPIHRAALLGNTKYACVACSGNSCSMLFSNFIPKQ